MIEKAVIWFFWFGFTLLIGSGLRMFDLCLGRWGRLRAVTIGLLLSSPILLLLP